MSSQPFIYQRPKKLQNKGATVWQEFTPLAQKYNAVNLGQGFPNFSGPDYLLKALGESSASGNNQYCRSEGLPRLVQSLAKFYSPRFERQIDWASQILVTCGATEALYSSIAALTDPGDELILIEPFFDIYLGAAEFNGAVPRYVPMKRRISSTSSSLSTADEFYIDMDDLRAVVNERSRILIINTPHNPCGKVFSREELEQIAEIVRSHPKLVVISDEVYEFLIFNSKTQAQEEQLKHVRIATLEGMWDRTLSIMSAGKTFSVTGWKVGWIVGSAALVSTVSCVHAFTTFSISTPTQEAIAIGFDQIESENYLAGYLETYQRRRDELVAVLSDVGLHPIVPSGSFFVVIDASGLKDRVPAGFGERVSITRMLMDDEDWNIARWLTVEIGVAVIPISALYSDANRKIGAGLMRLCFCKTDDILQEAFKRLAKLKQI